MKKILVTTDFCSNAKKLVDDNYKYALNRLRTVLILLANGRSIPKTYKDHKLTDKDYREIHVTGDVLLLYNNETDKDTLVVSLKLTNITDHKNLDRDSNKKRKYEYHEVSTQDLHDITSSIQTLTEFDEVFLSDLLESISDYASGNLDNGYILLSDFYIEGHELHCNYDYYVFDKDVPFDSIDFIIDLDRYIVRYIQDLEKYIYLFSNQVSKAFEG